MPQEKDNHQQQQRNISNMSHKLERAMLFFFFFLASTFLSETVTAFGTLPNRQIESDFK